MYKYHMEGLPPPLPEEILLFCAFQFQDTSKYHITFAIHVIKRCFNLATL